MALFMGLSLLFSPQAEASDNCGSSWSWSEQVTACQSGDSTVVNAQVREVQPASSEDELSLDADQSGPISGPTAPPWPKCGTAADLIICTGKGPGSSLDGSRLPYAPDPVPAVPLAVDPVTIVRQATATLTLPSTAPHIQPSPSDNEWGVLAVGLPLWVTVPTAQTLDTTLTQEGITIAIHATREPVRLDMGDGTILTCSTMTPRPADTPPLTGSPDCGHTYLHPGDYTVTAITGWRIGWSTLGQTGVLTDTTHSSTSVPVRDFTSRVVG